MFTALTLEQDDVVHSFEVPDQHHGRAHTETNDDGVLQIFVPLEPVAQKTAFLSALPKRLLAWIMSSEDDPVELTDLDTTAISNVITVLLADKSGLEFLLQEMGISNVNFEDDVDDISSSSDGAATPSSSSSSEPQISPSTPNRPSPQRLSSNRLGSPQISHEITHSNFAQASFRNNNNSVQLAFRPRTESEESSQLEIPPAHVDSEYRRVLDITIDLADAVSLPNSGASYTTRSGEGNTPQLQYTSQTELNCKIGAAGELFVSSTCQVDPYLHTPLTQDCLGF